MIDTLEERKAERTRAYERDLEKEELFEEFLQKVTKVLPREDLEGAIYSFSGEVNYEVNDAEKVELEILPKISELFDIRWNRYVTENYVEYITRTDHRDIDFLIKIILHPEDSCRIKKVPTGKTEIIRKTVEIEVPEYEYVVDCD